MNPSTQTYETLVLEPLRIAVQTSLSKRLLHGIEIRDARASDVLGFAKDQLVVQLEAAVWSDPSQSRTETHTIKHTKPHPDWRHALTASLPRGSFRRRWCHFFWDIPFDYANTEVSQSFEVKIPAVLPEMQRKLPDDMGRIMFPVSFSNTSYSEEPYYGPIR